MVITLGPRYKLARHGEALTALWLSRHGFHIIARNFRRRAFELDLVAARGSHLLIIEVKTRAGPVEDWRQLVPPRKLAALWRGVAGFLDEHPEYHGHTLHLGLALVAEGSGAAIAWMRLPEGPET